MGGEGLLEHHAQVNWHDAFARLLTPLPEGGSDQSLDNYLLASSPIRSRQRRIVGDDLLDAVLS